MPTLIVKLRDGSSATHHFAGEVASIGRDAANNIQIDDPSVSRAHAKLVFENGRFLLRDLGSTNKCFVDGKEVESAELAGPSAIRIGGIECIFKPGQATDADGELETARGQIALLTKERNTLKKSADELAAKISGARLEHNARLGELQKEHGAKLAAVRKNLDATLKNEAALHAEATGLRPLKKTGEELVRKISEIECDRDARIRQLQQEHASRLVALQAKLDTVSKSEAALQSEVPELRECKRRNAQLTARLADVERERGGKLGELQSRLDASAKREQAFQTEIRLMHKQAEPLAKQLSAVIANRDQVIGEMSQLAARLREKEQFLAAATAESGRDRQQHATLTAERDALRTSCDERAKQLAGVRATLDAAMADRETVALKLAHLTADLNARNERIASLTADRDTAREVLNKQDGTQKKIETVVAERDQLRERGQRLAAEQEEMKRLLADQREGTQRTAGELSAKLRATEQRLDDMTRQHEQIASLLRRLGEAKHQADALLAQAARAATPSQSLAVPSVPGSRAAQGDELTDGKIVLMGSQRNSA